MTDPAPVLMRGLLEALVLESLESAPKHGYALLREMGELFGAEPNKNKIYPLLNRLVAEGCLAATEEPEAGRTRVLYSLTDEGRRLLETYRATPAPFRDALHRVWPATATDVAPEPAPPLPPPAGPGTVQLTPTPPGPLPVPTTPTVARAPPDVPLGEPPYPCPDAAVTFRKAPRTGDLEIRLTGCPMGAYDYCPLCPVSASVAGMRRLLLGGP